MVARSQTAESARSFASADADHPYAALDLGSNSFHLLVAHYHPGNAPGLFADGGRLQVIDRHREMVRLAEGFTAQDGISAPVAARALACLKRIGQRIRRLPRHNVRVVGTNTLRKARNSQAFITAAEQALGHRVDIVSGREEARLIYLGVSHSLEAGESQAARLVVDIGGGSTELILGQRFQPRLMDSLHMGCVSISARFFPDGKVTAGRFTDAENAAHQELEAVAQIYRARGWDAAIGSSGTMLAVHDAIFELLGTRGISRNGLAELKERLCTAGSAEALALEAVDAQRTPVFAGGLAIVCAVFDALGVDAMTVSDGALREGLLHDLLGRLHAHDIRETTVDDLTLRYHVDTAHAQRVVATAALLRDNVPWQALVRLVRKLGAVRANGERDALSDNDTRRLLRWSAQLHEIGMDIAHSQYHKHGGYLLDNMDLPGFSRAEQHSLAVLVRAHRRKFPIAELGDAPCLAALSVLLRLAVLLCRSRTEDALPRLSIGVGAGEIKLVLPGEWLGHHPLTKLDLEQEADYLAAIPLRLKVIEK